jgi:hypothetical protein
MRAFFMRANTGAAELRLEAEDSRRFQPPNLGKTAPPPAPMARAQACRLRCRAPHSVCDDRAADHGRARGPRRRAGVDP